MKRVFKHALVGLVVGAVIGLVSYVGGGTIVEAAGVGIIWATIGGIVGLMVNAYLKVLHPKLVVFVRAMARLADGRSCCCPAGSPELKAAAGTAHEAACRR